MMPTQPTQQAPQQGGPDMLRMQLAQATKQNPEGAQRMGQLMAQAVAEGELDIPPEIMPQVQQLLQTVAQNPASWPQAYQQAVQMGADPQILPPPNASPEQIQQFLAVVTMMMYYLGEMGEGRMPGAGTGGMQGAQGATMPPQGQAPQGQVAGYAEGGVVGMPQYPVVGYQMGGMIAPPAQPMPFPNGDDQMIAAQTGEGVLNRDAVMAMGGPNAINALNYAASGIAPGGRAMAVPR